MWLWPFGDTFKNTRWKSQTNATNATIPLQTMQKFPQQGHLARHLKMHNEQRSNKRNQCSYAFSRAGHLRTRLKIHSGQKLNKGNQCDNASSQAGNLKGHLKMHSALCVFRKRGLKMLIFGLLFQHIWSLHVSESVNQYALLILMLMLTLTLMLMHQ